MDETKLISEKCSLREVISALGDLSEELELFGVPAFPELDISDQHEINVTEFSVSLRSLINASHYMLYRHRKLLREYEVLELLRMRDIDDNHALKATAERLKRELEEKEHALLKCEDDVTTLKSKLCKKEQELKVQNEEIRTVRCQLKYNEKKSAHDVRKKDLQINKLQVQLEKTIGTHPGKKDKPTAVSKDVKIPKDFADKEEKYQQLICKFEANNKGLMLENTVIKKALLKLNGDLASLTDYFNKVSDLHLNPVDKKKEEQKEEIEVPNKQEEMISHSNISLEECITSSNKYVESLNTLLDSVKEKLQ